MAEEAGSTETSRTQDEKSKRTPLEKWKVFMGIGRLTREKGEQMQQANTAFSQALHTALKNGMWKHAIYTLSERAMIGWLQYIEYDNPRVLDHMLIDLSGAQALAIEYSVKGRALAIVNTRLGQYYEAKGKLDSALEFYREAVNVLPSKDRSPSIYSRLGLMEVLIGNSVQGFLLLDRSLKRARVPQENNRDRLTLVSGVQMRRAQALAHIGQYQESHEALSQVRIMAKELLETYGNPHCTRQVQRLEVLLEAAREEKNSRKIRTTKKQ